jgi:hypothetical protein
MNPIPVIVALAALGVTISFTIFQRPKHWQAIVTVYLVLLMAVSILQHVAGLWAFWLFTIMQMAGFVAVYMASRHKVRRNERLEHE